MKKKYYYGRKVIQDGRLETTDGRIVIYKDKILVSKMRTADHNYLLRGLAARYNLNKDEVVSNAIRLYFRDEGDRVIITETRQLDADMLFANKDFYANLIKNEIR